MKLKYLKAVVTRIIMMVLIFITTSDAIVLADQGAIQNDVISAPAKDSSPGEPSEDYVPQAQILTLTRAKQIALEKSPTLASARERVNQAREAIVQARADYLPTLSTTAAWNYTEKTESSAAGYNENLYTNKVSATQLLFDGFMTKYSILSAKYGEKMNQAAHLEAQRLLAWSVAQTFLNVQLARENITIAESDMAFNREQEKEAVVKEKSGAGSLSDLLNFKTRVNGAKASLISAQQELKESLHGLAALLGYDAAQLPREMAIASLNTRSPGIEERYRDRDRDPYTDPDLDMENLLARRADLKQAGYAVKNADAGIHMAASDYYPTVSLIGSYGTTSGEEFSDMGNMDNMGASVAFTVNFELFSGGATRSRVREARSAKKELEKELDALKVAAVSDVKSAVDNITTARQQLALQKENTELMEKMRDLVEKEYNAGQASLVRLNEAQNDLIGTLGDLAIARVSLILAMERFDYYTGNNIK